MGSAWQAPSRSSWTVMTRISNQKIKVHRTQGVILKTNSITVLLQFEKTVLAVESTEDEQVEVFDGAAEECQFEEPAT
ncbi:hypothetical protein MTO96_030970 [Rhipicephalus appendiculatus]